MAMRSKRAPFIEGFREPTLTKNSQLILSDVRGDGEGKIVIWFQQQSKLIVYKGSDREAQKPLTIKNVNGIIQYYDGDEYNSSAIIALSAENGFYIFRKLNQSYRLRIPDVIAQEDELLLWSKYQTDPQRLKQELMNISSEKISEVAKYYISSQSIDKKKELIEQVFKQGINEKDSISCLSVITKGRAQPGNVVIGTEFNRLYILDKEGHSIINTRVISFVPFLILAYGQYNDKYVIVCFSRQGEIAIYLQNDKNNPTERIRLSTWVISADFKYPTLVVVTADQVVHGYTFSTSNTKIVLNNYVMKLRYQPIKVQLFDIKAKTMTLLAFEQEVRIYYQKKCSYKYQTAYKLYNAIFGSFAREDACIVLLYEAHGFEVFILSRQFNPDDNYGSNQKGKGSCEDIVLPKKTQLFLQFWKNREDESNLYKTFEKGLRLLKWRTLKERVDGGKGSGNKCIQMSSKVQGLGAAFIVWLQVENLSGQPLYSLDVLLIFDEESLQVQNWPKEIKLLAPLTPRTLSFQVRSISGKNQTLTVQLVSSKGVCQEVVCLPPCQQFIMK